MIIIFWVIITGWLGEGTELVIYESVFKEDDFFIASLIKALEEFKNISDVLFATGMADNLNGVKHKVYTSDLFNSD